MGCSFVDLPETAPSYSLQDAHLAVAASISLPVANKPAAAADTAAQAGAVAAQKVRVAAAERQQQDHMIIGVLAFLPGQPLKSAIKLSDILMTAHGATAVVALLLLVDGCCAMQVGDKAGKLGKRQVRDMDHLHCHYKCRCKNVHHQKKDLVPVLLLLLNRRYVTITTLGMSVWLFWCVPVYSQIWCYA